MAEGSIQPAFPKNRSLRARRRLLMFAIAPTAYLLFHMMRWVPWIAEAVYRNMLGPIFAGVLSTITGVLPIAVGEALVLALLLRYLVIGAVATADVARGLRQAKNATAAGILRLAQDGGVTVGLFYVLWGFNYAVPPLPERMGWPPLGEVGLEELTRLAAETAGATNAAYVELHDTTDAGVPTALPDDLRALEDALVEGWREARERMALPPDVTRFGRVKVPLLTPVYEWLGIAGFYFPFTGEANVRAGIPALDLPRIFAHEKTHQRGVARESEANFWGYLSAASSRDPLARYSALRMANGQMLLELARLDAARALEIADTRLPGVKRDIEDSRNYWRRFEGRGTSVGSTVNNAFLRSNRVEGGIRSYSMSAFLFLAYARTNGGRLVPSPRGGGPLDP